MVERIYGWHDCYTSVLDKNGIIIAHPIQKHTGVDVSKEERDKQIIENKGGRLNYTYDGIEKSVQFKHLDDKAVIFL